MAKTLIIPFLAIMCMVACNSSKKTTYSAGSSSAKSADMLDDNTFKLTAVSEDATYGYTEKNPVKVSGASNSSGPLNERRFLNALLGPAGQTLSYHRIGSCCPFKSSNGFMGAGMLDKYEVSYEGLEKPLIIYINMYDPGELKAPKGFTFRQS